MKGGNFSLLKESIENGENCSVFGLNIGERLALLEDSAFLFYVVDGEESACEVMEKLTDMGRMPHLLNDTIDELSSEFDSYESTIELLNKLENNEIDTIVLTPKILYAKFPNKSTISKLNIKVGDSLDVSKFSRKLVELGYSRVDLVSQKGEFSLRGDVVDIYPLSGVPTRIMTDFDVVESIREYNSITLLTTKDIDCCEILNNNYIIATSQDVENYYAEHKLKKDDLYYELQETNANDFRLLAFDKNYNSTIFDYVDGGVIAFDGAKNIYDVLTKHISDYRERVSKSSLSKVLLDRLPTINQTLRFDNKFTLVAFHFIQQNNRIFSPQKVFSIRTLPAVNYTNNWNVLKLDIDNFKKQGYTVILCSGTNEQTTRLMSKLSSREGDIFLSSRVSGCQVGMINLLTKKYPLNIILPEEKLAVISYYSIFSKPKKVVEFDNSFFDGEVPNEGDFVVHNFHGVGRCLGVKSLKISDTLRDYVVIEYKNSDKVYLPVENMNQLSKFIGSDKEPVINKIGGVEFAKTKAKVKSAVKKIAFDLIELYKTRMNAKGLKYSPDDQIQKDFEDSFGFSETVDQLKAINDCKSDMESGKVMDRLVCGDVGFGKTEVALRIAFKTILNGKQVAFLCPTTILSEQHYNTAKTRMANFGAKIDVINRLKSKQEESQIKKDFSDGKIDMICGTHKLLASDIDYKNLGLLILDEEQKFGVADKEKIKNIKKHVNVLTLSATPIPRTLNMSLIGVRDISVIETPPTQRLPSDVQVIEYSDNLVKMAITRELERKGQVLVIYNKVEDIYNVASKIKFLVPNAIVSVAHGQMQSDMLENEIFNLYTGKTQVLVATTLIENGVDLPNANTLIVVNSDMLGLSQLYQLKGRIGRSDKHSYAYFTFDNRKILTETAYKRLQAIKEFSQMGSGFKIAMRDLEIRGAGSLLGAEQSGHIEKLGYNMYVQLLNESVKELRGEKVEERTDIKVETSLPAFLSHEYLTSSSARMSMYREISNIDTIEKLVEFKTKTESVFGDMPSELDNLCKIALIKNVLSRQKVTKVVIKSTSKIVFEGKDALTKEIIDVINENSSNVNLSISDLPVVEIKIGKQDEILTYLLNFIAMFVKF